MTIRVAGAVMGVRAETNWGNRLKGEKVQPVPDPTFLPRAAYRSLRVLATVAGLDAAGKRPTAAMIERVNGRGGRVQVLGTLDDLQDRGLIAKWTGEHVGGMWVYGVTLHGLANLRAVTERGRCQAIAVGLLDVAHLMINGKVPVDPVLGEDGSDA